ncbi:hypothetical protein [Streptomyces sp. NPDC058308]|uniref:hypothetical protein n=1 Tax=Streptomyces sp. NPDC058308 TaxID=3346440 RepID=UPI0036EE15DC
MKLITRTLMAGGAAAAAAIAWSVSGPAGSTNAATSVAEATPGYAVEDFNYPQADKIQQEKGILLKRGDGHIMLAECGSQEGLLEIWARSKDKVCFRVIGNSGHLSLEIPAVFGIKGNSYDTDVTMTVGGREKNLDITKNTFTPVGETADPDGREHMLVEIRTSK